MRDWHARPWEDVVQELASDARAGLSDKEVRRRPAAERVEERPAWLAALDLFARQWRGSVILVLCAAAAAFWFLGHRNDAIGIVISVLFAVALGFATDFRSQRALAALESLNAPSASVLRDGVMVELPADRVVRGDIVILRGGAVVPADGRLIEAGELTVDEAALTGESAPAAKGLAPVAPEAPVADRTCMAYAGTTAVTGSGRMVVTEIGQGTELGRIGLLVRGYREEETPLEVQIEGLGRRLSILVIALSLAATLLGLALGESFWEMLELGFILAIAAIPEGLPAVNTVALAGGVRRMVRARSIVRRLAAVEVLGSVDVICTDKTGTLTENVMRAVVVCLPGRRFDISGVGYTPIGRFMAGTTAVDPRKDAALQRLLWIGALCNNALLESHEGWHVHGSPTEGALLTLAAQGGLDPDDAKRSSKRLSEFAFTSARKRMTVVVADESGARWSLAKGAAGALLPTCDRVQDRDGDHPLSDEARAEIRREAARLGGQGLRVLALAYRRLQSREDEPESGLVWAGMVGLVDPPRRNAKEAVRALAGAGVRTIMVTGDQKDTALAIAAKLGLAPEDVFARVSPEDKLVLVERLKREGHVVAMTGDGINDAPALKAADIGVAMGSGAADVAKEASDLVITDAEYATLTAAVEEGRRIYANLKRSARYLQLCSFANIGLVVGAVVLRLPLPMTPLQILWLNLVVHIFPAIALAVAPNPTRFLEQPPRPRGEPLLGWEEIGALAWRGLVVAGLALAVFVTHRRADLALARTLAVASLALGLLANMRAKGPVVWAALAASLAILGLMLYEPGLGRLLETVPLGPRQWATPACAALGSWAALSLLDRFGRR